MAGKGRDTPRDVPLLYPEYFTELLITSGTPLTASNLARLVEHAVVMIGAQGAAYYAHLRDPDGFEVFLRNFAHGGHGPRRLRLVDDIVDWLWAWNPGCREDLRVRFSRWRSVLLQPGGLLSSGADIPPFSEDEESPDYAEIWLAAYAENVHR